MALSFTSAVLEDFKGGAGGLGGRMGMGSVIHQAEHSDKTFNDVVGIDEAKGELEEIVAYLKDPRKFTRLGGKLPKGVLLTGPPGTGKTLLARAIAGEAGVPFFYSSGSEFEEMFVGVGARRVRELFDAAKGKSPCIIFIDEIDAIGGSRKEKDQSAMKMTLNQLLVEMDGFEQNTGVIVIAATNFPNSLDAALVRPGRFDKQVDVPMPDIGGRKAILELYLKKIPTSADVDTEQIARGTPGFSGAELYNLVNQAAVKASVLGAKAVNMAAFEYAKDKIMMGAERRSAVISPETMKMTAFHEAGHALVALKTDGADPIHKVGVADW
jgi:ATP-dependent metalloprotease